MKSLNHDIMCYFGAFFVGLLVSVVAIELGMVRECNTKGVAKMIFNNDLKCEMK